MENKTGNTPEHTAHRGKQNVHPCAGVYSTPQAQLASCAAGPDPLAVGSSKWACIEATLPVHSADTHFVALAAHGWAEIGPQHAHTCRMHDAIFWQGKTNCGAPSQIQPVSAFLHAPHAQVYSWLNILTKVETNSCALWSHSVACNAWFTFSLRQHKMRRKWECEEYIRFVYHILNLPHLKVLRNMSVNQSRVKRNENVSSHYRW